MSASGPITIARVSANFEREPLVRPFGLIEMVRTGEIAVQRGRHTT